MMQFLLSVQSRVSPTWSPQLAPMSHVTLHHLGVVAAHHSAHVVTQPVVTEELLLHVDALALQLAVEGLSPGHAGLLLTHEHRGLLEVGAVPIFLTSLQEPLIDLLKHSVTMIITVSSVQTLQSSSGLSQVVCSTSSLSATGHTVSWILEQPSQLSPDPFLLTSTQICVQWLGLDRHHSKHEDQSPAGETITLPLSGWGEGAAGR